MQFTIVVEDVTHLSKKTTNFGKSQTINFGCITSNFILKIKKRKPPKIGINKK